MDNSELNKEFLKKINIISSNINLGFVGGVNLGIRESNGKIKLILNSDTFHEPDLLEKMYYFIHIAQPKICYFPEKNIKWANGGKLN